MAVNSLGRRQLVTAAGMAGGKLAEVTAAGLANGKLTEQQATDDCSWNADSKLAEQQATGAAKTSGAACNT